MQQSSEGREQVCDPKSQACELFKLLAGALAMFEHFFNLCNQFVLFGWMKAYYSVVEIESPADPIDQWSECTCTQTRQKIANKVANTGRTV